MVAFVILHYQGINDTIKCVESIDNTLKQEQIRIVVVDNASPDGGGNILFERYKDSNRIDVIKNSINEGFSKGNNLGCRYAIMNWDIDFICVFNNDIFIKDINFIKKIKKSHDKTKFHVLGPFVWNMRRKYNQNPISVHSTLGEVEETINHCQKSRKLLYSPLPLLYYFYPKIYRTSPRKRRGLFGAALIFSIDYFKKYENVFPEITFMYGEEDFLYYRKLKDNLKFIYKPSLKVYHNHSASTRKNFRNIVSRWKFQSAYILDAFLKLREIYLSDSRI